MEAVGRVVSLEESGGQRDLRIEAPFSGELAVGDSVSIDGACLTVTEADDVAFHVTAMSTTLERTTLGRYGVGTEVNLERALELGGRLGGHIVQGHVDGVAELVSIEEAPGRRVLSFRLPPDVFAVTIPQGSITLSGISLTVVSLSEDEVCQVAIIPHTWRHTNLRGLVPGSLVNVEGDLVGRYVWRALEPWIARVERGEPPRAT